MVPPEINNYIFMKKIIASLILFSLAAFAFTPALAASPVNEDINNQLEPIADLYGGDQNVGTEDLAATIADIIQIVLGLLGIIFIILIIYAGLMWMTSAGNDERISKAKRIMVAAVIGVAIVLAAYIITAFVINSLVDATTN